MFVNVKELKETIAKKMDLYFLKEGYKFAKSKNQYVADKKTHLLIFNMLVTAWQDHYSVDVRIFISQKQVENIFEKILGKSHRLTIGNFIDKIFNSSDGIKVQNGNMAILLFQEEDIDAAVETIEGFYENIAKHYFAQYSTLESMDAIINNPPFDSNPAFVGGNFDERCMKGLIISKIINKPNFPNLLNIYNKTIRETMDIHSIENYGKVKSYLEANFPPSN